MCVGSSNSWHSFLSLEYSEFGEFLKGGQRNRLPYLCRYSTVRHILPLVHRVVAVKGTIAVVLELFSVRFPSKFIKFAIRYGTGSYQNAKCRFQNH